MQRYTNSGQTLRSMLALLAITGQIGRPGAGWMYANLQTQVFSPVKDPLDLYPPEQPDGIVRVSISTARLGRDMLATADPPLRVAWVERGNPIPQNPETGKVLEAFRRLRFRVVVDEFLTDTAREADVVLPAKSFFEQSDVIGAYWHPYLQFRQKVLDPPPDVRPETEIYRALGRRLGIAEEALAAALPGPSDADVEAWLAARLLPLGLTLEQLREGPVLSPGFQEVAFADAALPDALGQHRAVERRSPRALGRGRAALVARARGAPRPARPVPAAPAHAQHQEPHPQPVRQPRRDPAHGPGPRSSRCTPTTPRARGLAEGDAARVFNDRVASCGCRCAWTTACGPAAPASPTAAGCREGGAVNLLSQGRETDLGLGAAFHDNAVQVERA